MAIFVGGTEKAFGKVLQVLEYTAAAAVNTNSQS